MNFSAQVLLVSWVVGILFGLAIISKNPNWKKPRFWLGMLALNFGFVLFEGWGQSIELRNTFPVFRYTYWRLTTLVPLSMLFYTQGMVYGKPKIDKISIVLLFILILETAVVLGVFFTTGKFSIRPWYLTPNFIDALLVLACCITLPHIYRQTNKYKKVLENNFSNVSIIDMQWMQNLIRLLIGMAVLHTLVFLIDFVYVTLYSTVYLVWIPLGVLIFYMVYKGLTTPEIINEQRLEPAFFKNKATHISKHVYTTTPYDNSRIFKNGNTEIGQSDPLFGINLQMTSPREAQVLRELVTLIRADELFREPRLSLAYVARKVGYSSKEVSQVINGVMNMSFSDFINRFRVEDVKDKMVLPNQKLSLLGLAYEAGFNSKSSFNAVFKRFEGCSPTTYKTRKTL